MCFAAPPVIPQGFQRQSSSRNELGVQSNVPGNPFSPVNIQSTSYQVPCVRNPYQIPNVDQKQVENGGSSSFGAKMFFPTASQVPFSAYQGRYTFFSPNNFN